MKDQKYKVCFLKKSKAPEKINEEQHEEEGKHLRKRLKETEPHHTAPHIGLLLCAFVSNSTNVRI